MKNYKNKILKAALLLAAAFLALSPLKAQVTVGALRTPNSTLDVATQPSTSTTPDGMMAPRVALSLLNARSALYTANQKGALVYVTLVDVATIPQTVNITAAGYYYFDGAVWVKITDSKNPTWLLGGNTNGSLQTLGTKDAYDLPVITNNTEKMRVTAGGNVGINTNNPTATLDIVQTDKAANPGHGFILDDGNQQPGYTLTCDANGVGTWRNSGISNIMGVFPTAPTEPQCTQKITITDNLWHATNAYIDLPPGMWRIDMTLALLPVTVVAGSTNKILQQSTFLSDLSTLNTFNYVTSTEIGINASSSYRLISGFVNQDTYFTIPNGMMVIRNTSTIMKRYYLIVHASTAVTFTYTAGGCNAENTMVATPILSVD